MSGADPAFGPSDPSQSSLSRPTGFNPGEGHQANLDEIERLREALRHSQGRFLNINICLSSGGTKREAIAIADVGEDCIKMALGEQRFRVVRGAR